LAQLLAKPVLALVPGIENRTGTTPMIADTTVTDMGIDTASDMAAVTVATAQAPVVEAAAVINPRRSGSKPPKLPSLLEPSKRSVAARSLVHGLVQKANGLPLPLWALPVLIAL